MAKNNAKSVKIFEIIFYSICGALAIWGLTYIVLGLVAEYADIPSSQNYIEQASKSLAKQFGMGFLNWGIIIFCIGMGLGIAVLLIIANTVDKTSEKAARRAARLAKIEADMAEANQDQ